MRQGQAKCDARESFAPGHVRQQEKVGRFSSAGRDEDHLHKICMLGPK